MLAHIIIIVSSGVRVLHDHTNHICDVATTVYWRERDLHRFNQKLNSEDEGSIRVSPKAVHHLRMEKAYD
jgi:hypothetical protein